MHTADIFSDTQNKQGRHSHTARQMHMTDNEALQQDELYNPALNHNIYQLTHQIDQ